MTKIVISCLLFFSQNLFALSDADDYSDYYPRKVYVYQKQDMEQVNWLYLGFAPRMEDPNRIAVTISKGGYTLRVTLRMTAADIAEYPQYLVRRADDILRIASENRVIIFQEERVQKYLSTIETVRQSLYQATTSEAQFQQGLELLKKNFPQNIFDLSPIEADGARVLAVFVYPITTNKDGIAKPADGGYVQAEHYKTLAEAIQERRTDHGKKEDVDDDGDGVPDRKVRVVKDYLFSGFPAFWLNASEIGVHGPIRYSRLDDKPGEKMLQFWSSNEFLPQDVDMKKGLEPIALRWDLVRTNNSQGCFRAETMELRHLLPADANSIYRGVKWNVISKVDEIFLDSVGVAKKVDVNYYMVSPYRSPQKREEWVAERILTSAERKSVDKARLIEAFKQSSMQFPYLDPSIVEFSVSGEFDEYRSKQVMKKFNQAGGIVGKPQTYL